MNGNYHAKIIPPRLHGVVPRERLFKLLDRFADHPITWISSPAGSGKTTLVASYLKTRGIPVLWYRVDEADADIASFFYYMSEAAKNLKKGRNKPLPLFSSEFRFGISAFTHHYFDSLFTKMSIPTALVFDNYQDVPEDSEFHNVIKDGLKLVPDGMRILIASRKESPAPFVTLKTDRLLAYMDWEDLRFRPDEVKKMVEQKQKTPVSKEIIRRIHEETQGWAAAVVLMMDEEEMPAITTVGQSSVFNYFAMEVFPKFDPQVRDFLCITALLPEVSPEISAKLTGIEEGDAILTYLSRNQYFITRYGKEYRYHPLFREFLLNQAKKHYDTDKLVSVKIQAAHLLAQSGKIEEAIRLLFDAKAYKEALPVILSHAQKLLSQGRRATLEEWAESLPEDIRETSAWLSYSLGMGQLLLDPRKSTALLTKAFHLFESEQDKIGCLLSASAIINSLMLKFNEYTSLDPWMDWLDSNAPVNEPLQTPELEAQIASAMVLGITWRRPWHPNSKPWIDRAMSASRETDDISLRCTARGHVIENYGFIGHWKEMRLVAEELRQLTFSSHASTLVHIAYLFRVIETHDFLRDSWEDAYKRFQSAIKLAEEIGAHAFFGSVYMHGVWIAFEMKNPQMILDFLKKMEQTPLVGGWVGSAFYHDLSALYHLQMNDLAASHRDAMEAFKASIEASVPLVETWCRITLAYVLRRMGKKDETGAQIEEAEKIIAPCGLTHQLYLIYLVRASLALDNGDKPAAAQALRKAFSIGKEKGYEVTLFRYWQPDEMARLC
ncbi:MAG: malT, partial [Deltaproteobacteria bacterium]|nr:malT [Deltaproteobacteria bacterium]